VEYHARKPLGCKSGDVERFLILYYIQKKVKKKRVVNSSYRVEFADGAEKVEVVPLLILPPVFETDSVK